MFEKIEILFVMLALLLAFYLVIFFGAGKNKESLKIKKYLNGVRILIIILALVATLLWVVGFNY